MEHLRNKAGYRPTKGRLVETKRSATLYHGESFGECGRRVQVRLRWLHHRCIGIWAKLFVRPYLHTVGRRPFCLR